MLLLVDKWSNKEWGHLVWFAGYLVKCILALLRYVIHSCWKYPHFPSCGSWGIWITSMIKRLSMPDAKQIDRHEGWNSDIDLQSGMFIFLDCICISQQNEAKALN